MVAVPLTSVDSVVSLHKIMGYPLLAAGIKLNNKKGLSTVGSSPWEERDTGFFAYLALREDQIEPQLLQILHRLCGEDQNTDPLEGRFVRRSLPSFDDTPILDIYLEVKIDAQTKAQDVEKKLLDLVKRIKLEIY